MLLSHTNVSLPHFPLSLKNNKLFFKEKEKKSGEGKGRDGVGQVRMGGHSDKVTFKERLDGQKDASCASVGGVF